MVPKFYLMVPNGTKWFSMILNGTQWQQMVTNGTKWYPMVPGGTQWSSVTEMNLYMLAEWQMQAWDGHTSDQIHQTEIF